MKRAAAKRPATSRAEAEKSLADLQAARDEKERAFLAGQQALIADRPEGARVLWAGAPGGHYVERAVWRRDGRGRPGLHVERGEINARGRASWKPVRDPSQVAAVLKFAVVDLAGGAS